MPIRPIDLRRKEFKNGFRGYDANQVDDFLDAVADEFERTYTENQRIREEVTSLRERLQQFEDLEGSIRAALVHAEQASNDLRRSADREAEELRASANRDAEDIRRSAQREADLAVQDAQTRSRRMLADSSARVERVQESYEALQEAKRDFSNDFRTLLKTYMDVMENMEVNSAKEIEASLHNRLDTEAIAVAREAAREEEEAEETERTSTRTSAEPSGTEMSVTQPFGAETPGEEEADAGRTVSGHSLVAPGEVADMQTVSPEADTVEPQEPEPEAVEYETVATGGEDAHGADAPVADDLSAEDDRGVTDDAATQVLEPVGRTQTQPGQTEPETAGPLAGEPEVEPSTARGRSTGDAAVSGPTVAEEVEREEPALAEESGSQDFFEEEKAPSGGDSRIFRASRFLRRRG